MTDEPCCTGGCIYQPRMIDFLRRRILGIVNAGEDVSEVASSVLAPRQGYDRDRSAGIFGPTLEAKWALVLEDVRRELANGGTDEDVAERLCPFALTNVSLGPDTALDEMFYAVPDARWLRLDDAIARMGVSRGTFFALVERHGIRRSYPRGTGYALYSTDDIDRVKASPDMPRRAVTQGGAR